MEYPRTWPRLLKDVVGPRGADIFDIFWRNKDVSYILR